MGPVRRLSTLARSPWAPATLTALVCLGVLVRWYSNIADLGYLGWDSYPILATSGVESWAELEELLTSRLMAGIYPGDFYRPVLSLSVAAELALGGPSPRVSAWVQVILLAVCALLFFRVVRKLLPDAGWTAAVATVILVLHPVVGTVLPNLARRPELLVTLFLLWIADVVLARGSPWSWRRQVVLALLTLGAMASKETGFAAPLLVASLVALVGAGPVRSRLYDGVRSAALPVGVGAAYFLWRYSVLGGVGGHAAAEPGLVFDHLRLLASVLLSPLRPTTVLWASTALSGLALAWLLRANASLARTSEQGARVAAAGWACLWFAILGIVTALAGRHCAWYGFAVLPAFALLVALGLTSGIRVVRAARRHRGIAIVALAFCLLSALRGLHSTPVVFANPEWDRARVESEAFLEEFESVLLTAAPGDRIRIDHCPAFVLPPDRYPRLRDVAILSRYSLQAWVNLRYPDLRVRAGSPRDLRDLPQRPDEIAIVVRRLTKIRLGNPREFGELGDLQYGISLRGARARRRSG